MRGNIFVSRSMASFLQGEPFRKQPGQLGSPTRGGDAAPQRSRLLGSGLCLLRARARGSFCEMDVRPRERRHVKYEILGRGFLSNNNEVREREKLSWLRSLLLGLFSGLGYFRRQKCICERAGLAAGARRCHEPRGTGLAPRLPAPAPGFVRGLLPPARPWPYPGIAPALQHLCACRHRAVLRGPRVREQPVARPGPGLGHEARLSPPQRPPAARSTACSC